MSIDDMILREEIARQIEDQIDGLMPPVDEVEIAVYHALTWAAQVARGKDNYMTSIFEQQIDFE